MRQKYFSPAANAIALAASGKVAPDKENIFGEKTSAIIEAIGVLATNGGNGNAAIVRPLTIDEVQAILDE